MRIILILLIFSCIVLTAISQQPSDKLLNELHLAMEEAYTEVSNNDSVCQKYWLAKDLHYFFKTPVDELNKQHNSSKCVRAFDSWYSDLFKKSLNATKLDLAQKELQTIEHLKPYHQIIGLLNLSKLHVKHNTHNAALPLLLSTLELAKTIKKPLLEGLIYVDLVLFFHDQKEFKSEQLYLNELGNLSNNSRSDYLKFQYLKSLSSYLMGFENAENDSALICELEALALAKKIGVTHKIPDSYNAIATIYDEKGDVEKSLHYYNKALLAYANQHDSISMAYVNNNIGLVYQKLKKYGLALRYFEKATSTLEQKAPNDEYIHIFYYNLSDIYEKLGNYKKALQNFRKFDEIEYEKLNESRQKEIAQLQELYQSEQREQKIMQLNAENEIQQLQLEKKTTQRNYIIGFSCISLLLVTSIASVHVLNKQKTVFKLRKEMAEKNQELTVLALENENSTIKALSLGQETERNRIAQYLHDHIGNRIFAIKTNLLASSNISKQHAASLKPIIAITEIMRREIRELSHQLTDSSKPSFSLAENLEKLVTVFNVTPDLQVYFKLKGNVKLPSHIAIELYRIAQEALTNALKYSNASAIGIFLEQSKFQLTLSINDNGIGMPKQKATFGIGIENMKQRAEAIDATFLIDEDLNFSTRIIVQLLTS
jgi:two-component system NarL family sensor kinase